jgi:dynein heavy chain
MKLDLDKQRKEAKDKQDAIDKKTIIVNEEKEIAEKLAAEAEYQLSLALPALRDADEAVASLDKKAVGEVRAYAQPPKDIKNVMAAVMTVLRQPTEWASIKKVMADPKFMDRITNLDKGNIPESVIKKIEAFTKQDKFTPAILAKQSVVAEKLCIWVKAVEDYHKALKIVRPKQEKMRIAKEKLADLEASLNAMQAEFALLEKKLQELATDLERYTREMEELKVELETLQAKIERGEKLVTSLADEKERWTNTLEELREADHDLTGNAILSAAFMSLNGPFPADFRENLTAMWLKKIKKLKVPHSPNFDFATFLSTPATIRTW